MPKAKKKNEKKTKTTKNQKEIDKLVQSAIDAIRVNKLIHIYEVVSFLPICKRTFYNYGLHEMHDIKKELENNKVSEKARMRLGWSLSDKPALQISAFKLMATKEELERLKTGNVINIGEKKDIKEIPERVIYKLEEEKGADKK